MDVQQLIAKGYDLGTEFGVNILAALAVFIIGRWVVRYLRNLTLRVMQKREVDPTLTARFFPRIRVDNQRPRPAAAVRTVAGTVSQSEVVRVDNVNGEGAIGRRVACHS